MKNSDFYWNHELGVLDKRVRELPRKKESSLGLFFKKIGLIFSK